MTHHVTPSQAGDWNEIDAGVAWEMSAITVVGSRLMCEQAVSEYWSASKVFTRPTL